MKVLLWGGPEDGRVIALPAKTVQYVPEDSIGRGEYVHCPLHVPVQFEWRPVRPEESE